MGIQYYAFALFVSGLICLIAVLCKVLFADFRRQHKLLDEKETKLLELYRTVENIMEEFSDQAKATADEIREFDLRVASYAAGKPMLTSNGQPAAPENAADAADAADAAAAADVAAAGAAAAFPVAPLKKAQQQQVERLSRGDKADSSRIRAAGEAIERAERIAAGEPRISSASKSAASKSAATKSATSKSATSKSAAAAAKGSNGAVFQSFFDEMAVDLEDEGEAEPSGSQKRNEEILGLAEQGKSDAQIASLLGITRNEVKLILGLAKAIEAPR